MSNQMLSRRERRLLERENINNATPSRAGQILKKFLIWFGVIGGSVALVIGLAWMATKTSNTPTISGTPSVITDKDWQKGNKDAKVSVIEYSDFQCPSCGNFYPMGKRAADEFKDKINFVYRHYPLIEIHKNAENAAIAAEAAGAQGKFWEMHDMLFDKQRDWSESSDVKKLFLQYAEQIGLDKTKFETDLTSKDLKNKVADGRNEATSLKLSGTPSIFINNKIISNPNSYDAFKQLIQNAINSNP